MNRTTQRGDTIVEVMVAFAVFVLVATGAMTVMNRGLSLAQRSLEITLVREQIDTQVELLRYVRDVSPSTWSAIKSSAAADGGQACYIGQRLPSSAFYMTVRNPGATGIVERVNVGGSEFPTADVYSRVDINTSQTQGLWVVPVRVSSDAYDMYVRACWDSVGSDQPVTLGTIVRLYDT